MCAAAMHAFLLLAVLLFAGTSYGVVPAGPTTLIARGEPPRNSTGLTNSVQWDNTTFWVEGQRIFLHSGEFHTFRLPVPDLWLDIFQKIAATGMNGVRYARLSWVDFLRAHAFSYSIYIHCESSRGPSTTSAHFNLAGGLTNPAPGVLDFNDWRALQPMFDAAKKAGLFIVLRPG